MKGERRRILASVLRDVAQRLENGSCVMTDAQMDILLEQLTSRPLSKEQASIYLNMSRSNFDRLVREGNLPPGRKVAGFKELFWYTSELDGYRKR